MDLLTWGVFWVNGEYFVVKVTTQAAVFCMRWRRDSWKSGSPNKREFPISRRDVTKEWTIFSVEAQSRCFRNLPMLRMWNEAERTVLEMWFLNVIDESKMTPRLRTWLTGFMWESPTVIKGIEIFESCCGEPINMNSDLLSLIFRKLTFIHWRISWTQASMRLMQDWVCCCEGLKDTFVCHQRKCDIEGYDAEWFLEEGMSSA